MLWKVNEVIKKNIISDLHIRNKAGMYVTCIWKVPVLILG